MRALDAGGGVLGALRPRAVTFGPDGRSGFEVFSLEGARLRSARVGVHEQTWRWQFRPDAHQPWTDFATSAHRIYVVVSVPGRPWQQAPYAPSNLQLPWTAALEHACRWAEGARTLDEAAALVTRAVFDLGPELLEYGCPVGGFPQYAFPEFHLSAFLARLRGEWGHGPWVNCTDCATIVSTFANVLGCRLWQSGMGLFAPFALNEIVAIGGDSWETACDWGNFVYHEVAWKGGCTEDDAVYDACLLIDGDRDPTNEPHTPLLPVDLRFGRPGDGGYRDRLAAPAGRSDCRPLPWIRQHRPVR
jgi:hypothetical protein